MTPVIDESKCIGCGTCSEICPSVFQLYGEKSRVIDSDSCEYSECCEAAAENCPEGAITIEED